MKASTAMNSRRSIRLISSLLPGATAAAALSLGTTAMGAGTLVASGIGAGPGTVGVIPQPPVWAVLAVGAIYLMCYRRWVGSRRMPKVRRVA